MFRKGKIGSITSLICGIALLFAGGQSVSAEASLGQTIITLGEDLSELQKQQMLDSFQSPDAKIITVTNQEEHHYLDGLLSPKVIGTKSISSSLIQTAEAGTGIVVESHHITWVTNAMYENALSTAGLMDAKVQVDAPFPVSGTAALTGMLKAYETATGSKIDETRKKAANEELVTTGKLADSIGDKEKAAELLTRLKAELSKQTKQLSDDELRRMIGETAAGMGLSLSSDEIDSLVSILRKLQNLDINWNKALDQISTYKDQMKDFLANNPEAKSLFKEILQFLQQLIAKLLSWVAS